MIQLILDTEPNAKIIYLCPCRPWIRNLRKRKTVVAGCHFKSESMKTEKLLWTFWRSRKLFGAKRIPRKGFPSSLVVNVVLLKSSPNTQIPWTTLVLSIIICLRIAFQLSYRSLTLYSYCSLFQIFFFYCQVSFVPELQWLWVSVYSMVVYNKSRTWDVFRVWMCLQKWIHVLIEIVKKYS